jgi:ABC-type glycerol-3-phosphate transport system substrate-binding protein
MNLKLILAMVIVAVLSLALISTSGNKNQSTTFSGSSQTDGDLTYAAFYGGVPAGIWDEENFEYYLSQRNNTTGAFEGYNLYSKPVPTVLHDVIQREDNPDVMSSFVKGVLRDYVANGQIADLSNMWREEGWNSVFPASLKNAVSYNGKPYFVPQAIQWNPIFYQKRIFDEVGLSIPTTWDEMMNACDVLSEAEYIPFVISIVGWNAPVARWFSIINLRLHGHEFHESVMRGEVSYTDPRIREVFEHWSEMFEHNCFAEDSSQSTYFNAIQQLNRGAGAMYNLGEWIFEAIPVFFQPNFDFFAFPTLNPNVEQAEIVHIYGAFMLTDSDNRMASEDFLKYLGSEETQSMNAIGVNRLMGDRRVNSRYYGDIYNRGLDFVTDVRHLVPLFELSTNPDFAEPALEIFVSFWSSPGDIDSALNALETLRQEVF